MLLHLENVDINLYRRFRETWIKHLLHSSKRFEFFDIIFYVFPDNFHCGHTSLHPIKFMVCTIEDMLHTIKFTLDAVDLALCIVNLVKFVL